MTASRADGCLPKVSFWNSVPKKSYWSLVGLDTSIDQATILPVLKTLYGCFLPSALIMKPVTRPVAVHGLLFVSWGQAGFGAFLVLPMMVAFFAPAVDMPMATVSPARSPANTSTATMRRVVVRFVVLLWVISAGTRRRQPSCAPRNSPAPGIEAHSLGSVADDGRSRLPRSRFP